MFVNLPVLSMLIWLPFFGAALVVFNRHNEIHAKLMALCTSFMCLLLSCILYIDFDFSTYSMQFREIFDWVPSLGLFYDLGVDGISMPLVILTCFVSLLAIFATWNSISRLSAYYFVSILILQGLLVGVFASLNAILFYFFWESVLIPMFLMIGIWGGKDRQYAALKFFMYTFLGSIFLLVAILYLGQLSGGYLIESYYTLPLSFSTQVWLFIAFAIAFAIKLPIVPFHTWLPYAHTEAPTGGSVLLAAIFLKLGAYGFLRFNLPILPDACNLFAKGMIIIAIIAILYVALITLVQKDLKKLVAYSSIYHMGFVLLGFFAIYWIYQNSGNISNSALSIEGALLVIMSHSLISSALFIGIGFLHDRMHSRKIQDFKGIVNSMPIFSCFFMVFALANVGMPGTSGFVGEFMILLSSIKANIWIVIGAGMSLIFAASYTLWMYKRVIFGVPGSDAISFLNDIKGFELLAFILLALAVFFVGLFPNFIVEIFHSSVSHLLSFAHVSKL